MTKNLDKRAVPRLSAKAIDAHGRAQEAATEALLRTRDAEKEFGKKGLYQDDTIEFRARGVLKRGRISSFVGIPFPGYTEHCVIAHLLDEGGSLIEPVQEESILLSDLEARGVKKVELK